MKKALGWRKLGGERSMAVRDFRFLRIATAFGCAALLLLAQPAAADMINVTGNADDVKAFNDMIAACRKKSDAFNKLIDGIEKDTTTRAGKVHISVGRK